MEIPRDRAEISYGFHRPEVPKTWPTYVFWRESDSRSGIEIRNPVPDQLNGNGQNKKAEDLVDRAHSARSELANQRPSRAEEKGHAEGDPGDPDHHADVGGGVINMSR